MLSFQALCDLPLSIVLSHLRALKGRQRVLLGHHANQHEGHHPTQGHIWLSNYNPRPSGSFPSFIQRWWCEKRGERPTSPGFKENFGKFIGKSLSKPEGTSQRTVEKGQECYEFSLHNLSERKGRVWKGQGLTFLCF